MNDPSKYFENKYRLLLIIYITYKIIESRTSITIKKSICTVFLIRLKYIILIKNKFLYKYNK